MPMRTWPDKAVVLLSAWMTKIATGSDVLQASSLNDVTRRLLRHRISTWTEKRDDGWIEDRIDWAGCRNNCGVTDDGRAADGYGNSDGRRGYQKRSDSSSGSG